MHPKARTPALDIRCLRTAFRAVPVVDVDCDDIEGWCARSALLSVLLGVGVGSLCSLIGFAYPTLASFRAIETKQKGDDTQWLIYWTVYAFFSVLETFVDYVLYFVPFYYAFKLAFLVW